tara:strand:- start:294 stop:749 length:456 start_codon:yes stop_codon:yes gene_type:complete
MEIRIDDLNGGEVISLLEEHLADMYATSPPESVHALDVEALKSSDITFYSSWSEETLLGCVALKALSSEHVELKSMRTSTIARKQGVASKLLVHAIEQAQIQGFTSISLETGSQAFFHPARSLYEKFGFVYCGPFGDYREDPHSRFMTRSL